MKEIQIKTIIGINDLERKIRDIRKFIEKGEKVKILIISKGRQVNHPELSKNILLKIMSELQGISKFENMSNTGKNLIIFCKGETK